MGQCVGIDLGTTYSAIAYVNPQGKPEVIANERGGKITPSVVAFTASGPIVGDEAKEMQAAGDRDVASFFKRNMGEPRFLLSFYGREYTPTDLSTLVLEYLKAQAERFFHAPITDAVITVPAYFTHVQRTTTIEAGQKAGLNVLKIISEPTAAALAYGLRPNQRNQRVLVYDLGGGTFDVSLVSITADELNVIATDGDHQLGGKDWDDRLIGYLAEQFEGEFGVELIGDDINELRVQAEGLKRQLSARQSAELRVQASGHVGRYTVTRELFENLTRDLLERTQLLTEQVLKDAGLTWRELDGVLPVGGSTRMPMVHGYIEHMSGKPPMGGINPDEAVALGASIQAAMELERQSNGGSGRLLIAGRKQTTDVIAHSLGMIAESQDRSRYINSVLIRKNLVIPATQTRPYQMKTRRRGDSRLEVFLTQGESENPQHCTYLGCYVFSNFPALANNAAILDISYQYDKNGTVSISAIERSSRQPLHLTIEPLPPDVPARFAERPSEQQMREPLTIYLVIDTSSSMSGQPLQEAKKAAKRFVQECDLTSTAIGLISFSSDVYVIQNATQNAGKLDEAINSLQASGGTTGESFLTVYGLLNNVEGLRYAIVLTDGQWSGQESAVLQAKQCHEVGIEVIAIGFGGADHAFLERIASSSEQSLFTDLNRLTEAFSTIARELTESSAGGQAAPSKRLGWKR